MGPRAEQHHQQRPVPAGQPAAPVPATPVTQQSAPAARGGLVLPLGVVTRSDISRSLRELSVIDDFFHQSALRGGGDARAMPTPNRALDSLARANNLNLLQADHRSALKDFLTRLKSSAPVVHLSFPSEAGDAFIAKILEWFRREAHPHVVLHIGLQPELAAGCLVRTTNKMHDFSLRKRFEESKKKLVAALEALEKAPDRVEVADANATVSQEARL